MSSWTTLFPRLHQPPDPRTAGPSESRNHATPELTQAKTGRTRPRIPPRRTRQDTPSGYAGPPSEVDCRSIYTRATISLRGGRRISPDSRSRAAPPEGVDARLFAVASPRCCSPAMAGGNDVTPSPCPRVTLSRYRSLIDTSATAANTTARTQKRITTCCSLQPFKWKWWCTGEQRKIRLPFVHLK